MRKLTATLCLMFAVLLGSVGCQTTSKGLTVDNCYGYCPGTGEDDTDPNGSSVQNQIDRVRDSLVRGSDLSLCLGSPFLLSYSSDLSSWNNCYGIVIFPSGAKYIGEFQDNKYHGQGTFTHTDETTQRGIWENGEFQYAQKVSPTVTARKSPPPSKIVADKEVETLRKRIAALEKEKQSKPKQVAKRPPPKKSPPPKSGSTGSGFFVSKLGHIVTNEHVVRQCGSVTVGDNANKQVTASVLETDKRNDLALLRISSTQMASVETKSLISKLGLKLVPLASEGLFKSDDVELGEDVLVAGYPYGDIFSNTIKVTKGIVSASKGIGDDRGQFQMDAAVQPGNSGGPIYDENGNIVGVVVAQLNKLKVAKAIGSLPENVNFGIKASTVRQFLTSAGLPTKWSNRTERKSTKELAQIAKNQTVMVVCNP
jgi:S1-C subfamily serine protease